MGIRLWVDDVRPAPDGWHWAKTNTEAIRVLDEQQVDEISIDHDIRHQKPGKSPGCWDEEYNIACTETFEPTVRFVRTIILARILTGDFPKRVFVHTANTVACQKFGAILAPVNQIVRVFLELDPSANIGGRR